MPRNPLDNFHRSAEAAGYPALLIVSMISLGLVVTPVAVLGLTRAVWVLALALLSIPVALALLAAGIGAAFDDVDEALAKPAEGDARTDQQRAPEERGHGPQRTAA